ncbi:MAG TPA: hypothetical protein PLP57_03960 [Candidatus Saccharicenans sp.]|nr:hypothetical protein [Candidatus Saccharicenans sp.]HRD01782.1 hypothetical protein [Candidatus Saccharicenans sp.]
MIERAGKSWRRAVLKPHENIISQVKKMGDRAVTRNSGLSDLVTDQLRLS